MKKRNYVFLLIETDKLEKWIKVKNELDKDEELLEFRYTKMIPKYEELEFVDDTGDYSGEVDEVDVKAARKLDKHYR